MFIKLVENNYVMWWWRIEETVEYTHYIQTQTPLVEFEPELIVELLKEYAWLQLLYKDFIICTWNSIQ